MNPTASRILELLDDHPKLEVLYRQDPESFRDALGEASEAAPDSTTLAVWRARLEYREPARALDMRRLWQAIAIALAVGALVRIPAIWLGEEWYYPRLFPTWVILSLAAYFWIQRPNRRLLMVTSAACLAVIAYLSFLPGRGDDFADSVVMALIHLPVVIWALLAMNFLGDSQGDTGAWIRFVRYNGELLILGSLIGLGGMVLSGITVGLFELITEDPEEWYFANIGVFGAAAVPVAGTYLYDAVFDRRTGIATVLSRVFTPLFLVMVATYLVVAFATGQNPFSDREFLIVFNALLLLVLAMSVFSVVERRRASKMGALDYVNLGLIFLTLLINVIALSAIVFRMASYGFTPNRVAVLGANVVIFVHLGWLFSTYIRAVRGRGGFDELDGVVARYLPVYAAWAAVVTFLLPVAFSFA